MFCSGNVQWTKELCLRAGLLNWQIEHADRADHFFDFMLRTLDK